MIGIGVEKQVYRSSNLRPLRRAQIGRGGTPKSIVSHIGFGVRRAIECTESGWWAELSLYGTWYLMRWSSKLSSRKVR